MTSSGGGYRLGRSCRVLFFRSPGTYTAPRIGCLSSTSALRFSTHKDAEQCDWSEQPPGRRLEFGFLAYHPFGCAGCCRSTGSFPCLAFPPLLAMALRCSFVSFFARALPPLLLNCLWVIRTTAISLAARCKHNLCASCQQR